MSWTAASMVILGVALTAGFAWWERSHPPSRLLALVATLAALAAIGRIAFAPIPSVKPTTDIVLFAGFALGAAPGFAVGAVAAVASNFFFGQGPWTPWQMAAWGLVGLLGAGLARVMRHPRRVPLALACGFAGLLFGEIMNASLWVQFSDHSPAALGAYVARGVPFDVAHVAGNLAFCLAFGPAFVAALARFRARLDVRWVPLVAAGLLLLAAAPLALAAPTKKSAGYLVKAQNADGGFGGAPGQSSNQLHSGWTALGLEAAGRNPADVTRGGKSVLDYMTAQAGQLNDLGELARTVLVLDGAGRDPRAFAGRDLVAELTAKQSAKGAFAGRVNTTAFAVLALRAAGRSSHSKPVRRAVAWLSRQPNADGGFNFAGRGGQSGIDDTGAPLQALVAAGRRGTRTVRRAARFLTKAQNPDGGFPLSPGGASNAQSTAWAVQGLVAAGRNPAKVRTAGSRSPLGYLRSLTAANGAVRYSRTSAQTPVWVTAQALTALARKPFPLAAVARTATAPVAAPRPTPAASAARKRRPRASTNPPLGVAIPEIRRHGPDLRALAHRAGLIAGTATALLL